MFVRFMQLYTLAGVAELVDARDSKSRIGNNVWVRFPPPAPELKKPPQTGEAFSLSLLGHWRVTSGVKECAAGCRAGRSVCWQHQVSRKTTPA